MPYLLDTNALSEVDKPQPNQGFMDWFNQAEVSELYVSCITLGELYKGIELLTDRAKRNKLKKHTVEITKAFSNRVLIINLDTTIIWSRIMAASIKKSHTAPSIDALIASQSLQNNLILVTHNTKDFKQFDELEVYSPWS
ncbi:MAG: PIN domain-containing protein [Candidatus Saccharimonadales bacterium]